MFWLGSEIHNAHALMINSAATHPNYKPHCSLRSPLLFFHHLYPLLPSIAFLSLTYHLPRPPLPPHILKRRPLTSPLILMQLTQVCSMTCSP